MICRQAMGRSSLGEVEKSEGQGLVAGGGGWVVRGKETRTKTKEKERATKEGGKEKKIQRRLVSASEGRMTI